MLNERRFFLSLMPYLLLFIAGTVDAVGFLHLKDGVFASFMSGNSTHMGMMLSYHDYPRALLPTTKQKSYGKTKPMCMVMKSLKPMLTSNNLVSH